MHITCHKVLKHPCETLCVLKMKKSSFDLTDSVRSGGIHYFNPSFLGEGIKAMNDICYAHKEIKYRTK